MSERPAVGRRYAAVRQVLEGQRVGSFAAAVSGGDPAFAPGSVPPTFAAVYGLMPTLSQLFADPDLGIDLAGLIHAEQSFEWPHPPHAGDVVDAVLEIESLERRRGLTILSLRLEASNQAGEVVCRGRSMLLARGKGE